MLSNLIHLKLANKVRAIQNLTNFKAHHKFNQLTCHDGKTWKNIYALIVNSVALVYFYIYCNMIIF